MSSVVTFNKTHQFLTKFIDTAVIMTAITYPKIKYLSLLFIEILTINSFLV